jgi:Mat/Ecp fimbriae major subunit
MNNMQKISLALLAAVVMAPAAHAATATGDSEATVLQSLSVSKGVALNFGKIVAGSAASTVELTVAGSRNCGVGLTCLGNAALGDFTLTGYAGQGVSVSTDGSATLTSGSNSMTTTLVPSAATLTLTGGTAILKIGGTLSVGANQAPGVYTGTYNVTVNYS